MGLHPISAGHGYLYLTRQTAVQDASPVPAGGIGAYYAERGESPGRWLGRGLVGFGVAPGSTVSEAQMLALFGEGRHPDTAAMTALLEAEGADPDVIDAATELGRPFLLNLANTEFARQVAQLAAEWNTRHGQPACASAPAEVTARIRTAVGRALFAREHGREAADARELSGFIAQQSRLGSKAVAGFDLTFSPVKSVSALWALAPSTTAREIEAAHQAAVEDALDWLERTAVFTRLGRNGVRQVDVRGLVAAAFVHRTSRAGDPDLHTHVAVSNKVQTLDGRWRALDGRVLFKAAVAASERYNTRLEAELRERLGVGFVEHQRPGKRPVRELAGIDDRLLTAWSRRRAEIDTERAGLTVAFEAEHGRPPAPVEAIGLAQRATLATRPDKHPPRSEAEVRQRWRQEAIATIGASAVQTMLDTLTRKTARAVPSEAQIADTARRVIERVQSDRATWQRWHVIAEAQRAIRDLDVPVAELDDVVDRVVDRALRRHSVALPKPDGLVELAQLLRADGASVYTIAGSQLYTSHEVLAAEQALVAAAHRFDGQQVDDAATGLALLEATANGLTLNNGQAEFVRALAGSGARCQLALAPAGTGKTTALQVLARSWTEAGGHIVALAPSAAAAQLLGDATGVHAETIAKIVHDLAATGRTPIRPNTLVLVDEAGMAATPDLATIVAHAIDVGGSVRLVGDDRQLAAIGAGGVLRDLAETTQAVTLQTAVRFADPAEAHAALGIRDGSPAALEFYLDRGRVHVGDEHTALLSAYAAWRADRTAGRDALLIAATREQAAALNTRARTHRLADTGDADPRQQVRLADGCTASAGDAIITRRNDRRLGITATDWVKNGDRWTVHAVRADGSIDAVHRDTRRRVRLPAGYVAEHVTLGYAVTIHTAQGVTADTCHTVLAGTESREQLYVALSRARHANHVHVVMTGADDEHAVIRRDTLIPPTATDLLARILERESAQRSATTEQRMIADPARRLRDACARYTDSLRLAPAPPHTGAAGPAPLPWLEPVPTCTDPAWRDYLTARAAQITALADEITRATPRSPADATYRAHAALWTATHPTGHSDTLTEREALYRRHLAERRHELTVGRTRDPRQRWVALVAAVDRRALYAPQWPALADALSRASAAGLDIDRMLPQLLHEHRYADALATLDRLAGAPMTTRLAPSLATPTPGYDRRPSL